jgi:hypothetical protein
VTYRQNLKKETAARLKQAREKAGYFSPYDFCQKHAFPLDRYLWHEEGEIVLKSSEALRYAEHFFVLAVDR